MSKVKAFLLLTAFLIVVLFVYSHAEALPVYTVPQGGTGASTFGQGWIYSNGGTGALAASTTPTVDHVVATSSKASILPYASTTAITVSAVPYFTALTNALLGTDQNGRVVATTSVSTGYLTGTLPVTNGGTGAATFGQGWIYSSGGTGALAASTSPTVNYIAATSTTATSTYAAGISATRLNTTATSTGSAGWNLTGGCFSINNTCIGGASASSTLLADRNTWSALNNFSNSTSTLFTATTGWIGTLNLTNPLGIASGGTATSTGGNTNGIEAYDGSKITNYAGYTLTSSKLSATNASTTNFSVNGNPVSGERYPVWSYATSTTWAGTTTVTLVAPFNGGSLNDMQCETSAGTLNVQFLVNSTNVSPMFNASTTKGTVTFTSNKTFVRGDTLKAQFGTPASSPTSITCTGRSTGY